MLFGGKQEQNFRPGTEKMSTFDGLGKAAVLVSENCQANEALQRETHMRGVQGYLEKRLEAESGKEIRLNSWF